MNSIEDRLRESLRDRATDVEPTPQLWERVQRETRRRTQITWLFAGLSVAAVVGALAVAVPALLDDEVRSPVVGEPTEPSDQQTPPRPPPPGGVSGVVTTDGARIVVHDHNGAEQATVLELDPGACECEITDVAVSPASTREDLFVVYTVLAEGMWDHRWLHATSPSGPLSGLELVDGDYFVGEAAVSPNTAPASTPAVAFSPEGEQLAWVEMPASEAASPVLRILGMGPGGPTSAGVRIDLVDLPSRGYVVEDWNWTGVDADGRAGMLALSTDQDGLEVYRLPFRTDDTGLVTDIGAAELIEADGLGAPIDVAFGSGPAEHRLYAQGAGEGAVRFSLYTFGNTDGDTVVQAPLPDDVVLTSDPSTGWIDALGDAVLVGHGARAWLVEPVTGDVLLVSGTVSAGVLLGSFDPVLPAPPTGPSEEIEATAPPREGPGPPPSPRVSIEGDGDVVLYADGGSGRTTLLDSPCTDAEDCEFRPARLAVRPGSTPDDLTILVLWLGDGAELGWIRVEGDAVSSYTPFPDHLQVSPGVVGSGSLPVPAWSPDGRHVAWIEEDSETSDFTLRTIGWNRGPGTGGRADDNASWGIDASDLDSDEIDLELSAWGEWRPQDDAEQAWFTVRTRTAESGVYLAAGLTVERQSDGALALLEDGFGFDHIVEPHDVDGDAAPLASWLLRVAYGDEPLATDASVLWLPIDGRGADLGAPPDLISQLTDGWHLWIEADDAVAYLGDDLGGRVWRITAEGEFEELEGVRHIAPVR